MSSSTRRRIASVSMGQGYRLCLAVIAPRRARRARPAMRTPAGPPDVAHRRASTVVGVSNTISVRSTRCTEIAGCGTCVPSGSRRRALMRSPRDSSRIDDVEATVAGMRRGRDVPRAEPRRVHHGDRAPEPPAPSAMRWATKYCGLAVVEHARARVDGEPRRVVGAQARSSPRPPRVRAQIAAEQSDAARWCAPDAAPRRRARAASASERTTHAVVGQRPVGAPALATPRCSRRRRGSAPMTWSATCRRRGVVAGVDDARCERPRHVGSRRPRARALCGGGGLGCWPRRSGATDRRAGGCCARSRHPTRLRRRARRRGSSPAAHAWASAKNVGSMPRVSGRRPRDLVAR